MNSSSDLHRCEGKYLKDSTQGTGCFFHLVYKKKQELGRLCYLDGLVIREGGMRWESQQENRELQRHTEMTRGLGFMGSQT